MRLNLFCFILIVLLGASLTLGGVKWGESKKGNGQIIWLCNGKIRCSVFVKEGRLSGDRLEGGAQWLSQFGAKRHGIETDADFGIDVMWTGWRAPGKQDNGDNPVVFSKVDFRFQESQMRELPDGGRAVDLYFNGSSTPFQLKMTYRLGPGDFYVRRRLAVRDRTFHKHFLRKISVLEGTISGERITVVKEGGFGQPAALTSAQGSAFFGLEYPASRNQMEFSGPKQVKISCNQWRGQRIGKQWIDSDWAVIGLVPDTRVKHWFFRYLDDIRVAPLKPYTLYNSWYDLRAADYPSKEPLPEERVMNEKNVLRMIKLVRENMIDRHGIRLDAFVLDDGWDVYESDWLLRPEQFPNGLKPITRELKKTGTVPGIWFGPTGGYSARMKRINWMKAHSYEVVGLGDDETVHHNAMLCLAGEKYSRLFRKRVVGLVEQAGVGYFKWDGIQFSCSQPDHGHPVGIYSRRAVLESLIDACRAVRQQNPDIFLNITSGTWLSPWWLQYTNQIWMDGRDYGYANVPALSRRDSAMTYRDSVLYEDFQHKDLWFPVANLMTHGIIKGNLQQLGGESEPIDKFTDNALLYFARGVSMWELYISPDLLTEAEWQAIARSINWALDRFPILKNTDMIGGSPVKGETYGYVHFDGNRGIIAARNPSVQSGLLTVKLSPDFGLDPYNHSLVLEQVYPSRRVSPTLYSAGAAIRLPLGGYETAIYELYPLDTAGVPLLAGVAFDEVSQNNKTYNLNVYESDKAIRLLNPGKVKRIFYNGAEVRLHELFDRFTSAPKSPEPVQDSQIRFSSKGNRPPITVQFRLHDSIKEARLAVLLRNTSLSKDPAMPVLKFRLSGKAVEGRVEQQEGMWAWYTIPLRSGQNKIKIQLKPSKKSNSWRALATIWLTGRQREPAIALSFEPVGDISVNRPLPPRPRSPGERPLHIKIGGFTIGNPQQGTQRSSEM